MKRTIITLGVSAALIVLALNYRNIRDHFALADYTPSSQIAAIAKTDTMTKRGRDLFYMTHPEVYGRGEFSQHCPVAEAGLSVLGCYQDGVTTAGRIALFKIDDLQLADEIDVTAAHEMLHSAYAHLSYGDKQKVNDWLRAAYLQIPPSKLTEVIKNYYQTGNFNELHSHLGTEYVTLTPELETYYRRYFSDRAAIAKIHQGNEALLKSCESSENSRHAQIDRLKQEIENDQSQLEAKKAEMDRLKQENRINEYNAEVPEYNRMVANYNNSISYYNSLIAGYNNLITRCNALSLSYDSNLQPIKAAQRK